jgi:hypothetical protein
VCGGVRGTDVRDGELADITCVRDAMENIRGETGWKEKRAKSKGKRVRRERGLYREER